MAYHTTNFLSNREKGIGSLVGKSTRNPTGYHCSVHENVTVDVPSTASVTEAPATGVIHDGVVLPSDKPLDCRDGSVVVPARKAPMDGNSDLPLTGLPKRFTGTVE